MEYCIRKVNPRNSKEQCGHMAVKKDNENNNLCKYHYKEWIGKLYKAGNAYYKGAVSTKEHIMMLIYIDGIGHQRHEEVVCDTIIAHTNLPESTVIHFMIELRPPDIESWLVTKREWAEKHITIKNEIWRSLV